MTLLQHIYSDSTSITKYNYTTDIVTVKAGADNNHDIINKHKDSCCAPDDSNDCDSNSASAADDVDDDDHNNSSSKHHDRYDDIACNRRTVNSFCVRTIRDGFHDYTSLDINLFIGDAGN